MPVLGNVTLMTEDAPAPRERRMAISPGPAGRSTPTGMAWPVTALMARNDHRAGIGRALLNSDRRRLASSVRISVSFSPIGVSSSMAATPSRTPAYPGVTVAFQRSATRAPLSVLPGAPAAAAAALGSVGVLGVSGSGLLNPTTAPTAGSSAVAL